jgi:hypothetical protein
MKAINVTNYEEMLAAAVELCAGNAWEEQFTADTSDKYKKYGPGMFVSDKQVACLAKIAGIDPIFDMDAVEPPKPTPPSAKDGQPF